MDIECKLKREGGTIVDLGTNKYHFAPLEDGAHVATVTNEAHQERLLSIPEAYKPYLKRAKAAAVAAPVAPVQDEQPPVELLGAPGYLDGYEFHGKTYAIGEVIDLAFKAADCTTGAWNALTEDERADKIDAQLDKLEADTNGDGEVDKSEERAALVKEYEAKFNKKPGRMSTAKIREALAAE